MLEEGSVFLPTSGNAVTTLPIGNQRPSAELLGQLNASIPAQPRLLSGVLVGDWISAGVGQQSVQVGFAQAIDAAALTAQSAGLAIELEQAEIQGFHPGRGAHVKVAGTLVGSVGELHPDIAARLYLPRRVALFEINLDEVFALAPEVLQAAELRVMPAATQDLSLVVDVGIPAASIWVNWLLMIVVIVALRLISWGRYRKIL
jgi:phenylalanyl-tRNA synthetase beta chain